jgi:hypothetical protein
MSRWRRTLVEHRARSSSASEACGSGAIWEHAIRNDADLERHVDYIHFNPVKHGLVSRVGDWPQSDPDASARFMAEEVARWRAIIKAAGVTLE